MPKALERQAEGYATHLGAKPGTEKYDRIKYGTMRAKGWTPSTQKHKTVLGQHK